MRHDVESTTEGEQRNSSEKKRRKRPINGPEIDQQAQASRAKVGANLLSCVRSNMELPIDQNEVAKGGRRIEEYDVNNQVGEGSEDKGEAQIGVKRAQQHISNKTRMLTFSVWRCDQRSFKM